MHSFEIFAFDIDSFLAELTTLLFKHAYNALIAIKDLIELN